MKRLQTTLLAAALLGTSAASMAEDAALKVGLMLPATGTYAQLGTAIENGFKLYVDQAGGKLGGRGVEYVKLDDESDPAKATDNINKLIKSDKVDVVVGTVHSGVAAAMAKVAKQTGTLLVVPNAGSAMITGPMCAPNIFRSSFSNRQPGFAMGKVAAEKGYKKVATITWKYGAGEESVGGFKEAFEADGGEVVKELYVPFPNVEFQALLTEIAALKPDAVYSFFAGAGAVKFVKDYKAAGLMDSIPLLGAGFLTDGTLKAQGGDGEGLLTTLHYADELDNETDKAFRKAYSEAFDTVPDVYAVQGFDAAQILDIGLQAAGGDVSKTADIAAAVEATEIDSPRGKFTLSRAHNPIQDIYLREAKGEENVVIGVAVEKLDDPAKGCRL
ncbi:MAG: ABC transporter substrate-binding protein [Thiothrix sp.]|nr:ABC transporter substrate-binding protein [Thiothrix sp.]HPQ95747.1 ABC transporter substrate-binding protein [Thiolinea sp.]